ncbi:SNF2 helicase associated domain-containing protein [Haloimpatiens sp. FM7315]|uniref:SNF2 helicase associated domain-containing protein n=1 Tax=Haloimpatiens sp. FM7315 TaxID=3298609 RepID=UPI003709DD32
MILSTQIIKNWVNDATFKSAKQYYEGGFVEDLKIENKNLTGFKKNKSIEINSRVISFSGFNSYEVNITLDSASNDVSAYCSCEDKKDNAPCKHVTAVLLKYINEYQRKIYGEINKVNEIDNLIESLKNTTDESSQYKRELNLEIKFNDGKSYFKPYIELKLGVEKNYVVKSMKKFLLALLDREIIQFGKNFSYDPSLHKFNECDEKIIEMLLEIVEIEEEHENSSSFYRTYDKRIFDGKKLLFTDKLLYRFFKLAKERNIDAAIDGEEYTNVKILERELPLKFKIGMNKESIELSEENKDLKPIGGFKRVFFYNGSFYLPPKNQVKVYEPIFDLLKNKKNKRIIVSKKEGDKIASYLLPVLKKVSQEVKIDKNVQDLFFEKDLTIKTYIDKQEDFVTALVKYKYEDIEIDPFKKDSISSNKGILIRNIEKEENCDKVLRSFGFEKDKNEYVMKNEGNIVSFIDEGLEELQNLSEVYYSDSFRNIKLYGKSSLKAGIKLNSENLLEFNFEIEGVDREELKDIFKALREKKKYYKLKKGGFVSLKDEGIKDIGKVFDYLGIEDKELFNDKILLSKYNSLYLDQKIKDKDMDYVNRSKDFRELVNSVRDIKEMEYDLPEHIDKIMRNYQKTGFKWFKTLAHFGFGGILADEMGLGKTLQAIAFLASESGEKPSIVVAPTSLLYNWEGEIQRFAKELKVIVMSGTKNKREELMENINKCDIVVTSYPLIRRDIEEYKNIDFKYCILDEAQQIKNAASINASSVKKIKAEGYFALTGTPMENSLTELWSIFDFIMPGYLFSHSKFSKLYERPIVKNDDKMALEELNRHIKPFILRRLKKDVLKELPSKIEHKLVVEMTEEQKKLYAAYSNSAKTEIEKEISNKGFNKSRIKILSILTRLRQICCDPSVFVENFKGDSGKMLALYDLLDESINQGHKVLVFSQFTSVLKNIIKILDKNNMEYLYLDGNTKSEARMDLTKKFNEGKLKIFLISLKAGGTGLNLTGADTVIHFDPWWNPAVEEQATDRAHRIGQKKTVEVIKLISKGTIEEKIYNLQEKKKKIINNVINEDMNEDNVMTKMTQEDFESLFTS